MGLTFEWDRRKASANLSKHGVTFEEASTAFGDPLSLTIPDPEHSIGEERLILLGQSGHGRLLELLSRVVYDILGGDLLDTIDELHTFDHLGQEFIPTEFPPSLLSAVA